MPGRPGHHTHGCHGLHRTDHSRPTTRVPARGPSPKEHAWTSCPTCTDSHTTATRRWSRHSLSTEDSSQQPAPAWATWPNVKRRKSSKGIPASTWFHSYSKPLDDPATMHKSSSNINTATWTTHQQPPETPGPPCKLHSTAASPNNNCEPSPRDSWCLLLTSPHAIHHRPLTPFSSPFRILLCNSAPHLHG